MRVKPLQSTRQELNRALIRANNKIARTLSKSELNALNKVLIDFERGKDTKSMYSKNGKW